MALFKFAQPPRLPALLLNAEVHPRRFALSDESLAALSGVSLDDYYCYQIVAWGATDKVRYRAAWQRLLVEMKITVEACNRLLGGGGHKPMTFFFVRKPKAKKVKYHYRLSPAEVRLLAYGLDLAPATLAGRLGLPAGFCLLRPGQVNAAPLAERVAEAANGSRKWLGLVHERVYLRYGLKAGWVDVESMAWAMFAELPLVLGTCEQLLLPSQSKRRRWNAQRVAVVCRLLHWPLADAATAMGVTHEVAPVHYWLPLEPLDVEPVPPLGHEGWRNNATRRLPLAPLPAE
ncbi:MAG TPA: hypothetical protein VHP58_01960 [Alphaproteobacteria bacterium]|nr:hypothetical protein [Alphaproteobacteria bacterium]